MSSRRRHARWRETRQTEDAGAQTQGDPTLRSACFGKSAERRLNEGKIIPVVLQPLEGFVVRQRLDLSYVVLCAKDRFALKEEKSPMLRLMGRASLGDEVSRGHVCA